MTKRSTDCKAKVLLSFVLLFLSLSPASLFAEVQVTQLKSANEAVQTTVKSTVQTAEDSSGVAEVEVPEVGSETQIEKAALSTTLSEEQIPFLMTEAQVKQAEKNPYSRMIWGGLAFVAFLVALWVFLQKFRFGNFSKKAAIPIRMIHQFHLAPKRSLAVVEVAGEYLLLGVTDHSVNLVKTLSLLDEDLANNETASSAVFEQVFDEKLPMGEDFEIASTKSFGQKRSTQSGYFE